MNLTEAMAARHSVRQYRKEPLEKEHADVLGREIRRINEETGLHLQLITDEPNAFDSFLAHYGWLRGVTNYIALVGRPGDDLDEACGYWGEHLVLLAQMLGLNTCWVAATYKKTKASFVLNEGEKLLLVIAVGYGENQGHSRKSKQFDQVAQADGDVPDWFRRGVEAALLAPTAVNQQKFKFTLRGSSVEARATAKFAAGAWAKVDLGIAKYHFEIGAGRENFTWV